MVIYLDQYRIAKVAPADILRNGTYGDERLNTSPVFTLLALPPLNTSEMHCRENLTTADIETLLAEIYPLATQI